jgi:hypothetical protein
MPEKENAKLDQSEIDSLSSDIVLRAFDDLDDFELGISDAWPMNIPDALSSKPFTINEFEKLILERKETEKPYGIFDADVTVCRFRGTKNGDEILAEIERKNAEQGVGNVHIPNTKITLINYSVCPKCGKIFPFKELAGYYAHPKPDALFASRGEQFKNDTRVCCSECDEYFLPALIISDGTPKNEVQFLCRSQTANAIESFFIKKGRHVLSAKKENHIRHAKQSAILTDILLSELAKKPTLISNLIQYTPAKLTLNLLDGSNIEKGDVLYGVWR